MGVDLIVHGFTVAPSEVGRFDADALRRLVGGMTPTDAELDEVGAFDVDGWRLAMAAGAAEYVAAVDGHRFSASYVIRDRSPRWFVLVGGSSSGDDPFDGFGALSVFLDSLALWPALAAGSGFLGWGIVLPADGSEGVGMTPADAVLPVIDNDQGCQDAAHRIVRDAVDAAAEGVPDYLAGITTPERYAAGIAADELREWCEAALYAAAGVPDGVVFAGDIGFGTMLLAEALRDYIAAIDWRDVAGTLLRQVAEIDAYESEHGGGVG